MLTIKTGFEFTCLSLLLVIFTHKWWVMVNVFRKVLISFWILFITWADIIGIIITTMFLNLFQLQVAVKYKQYDILTQSVMLTLTRIMWEKFARFELINLQLLNIIALCVYMLCWLVLKIYVIVVNLNLDFTSSSAQSST